MIRIIRKEETKTTRWSGGTTTQLAIWPIDGDYGARRFVWRVSSACVEVEESEFTSLPGVNRCLMILDGALWLKHEGLYERELSRFQQDNFDGGWHTISRGRVTDFNLMVTSGDGRVQVLEIASDALSEVDLMPIVAGYDKVSEVFYILTEGLQIENGQGCESLYPGDVVMVVNGVDEQVSSILFNNTTACRAEIIRAIIYHCE